MMTSKQRAAAVKAHADQVMAAHRDAVNAVPDAMRLDVLARVMAESCFLAAFMAARYDSRRHDLPGLISRGCKAMFQGWLKGVNRANDV